MKGLISESMGILLNEKTTEIDYSVEDDKLLRFFVEPEDRNKGVGTASIKKLKKEFPNLTVDKKAFNKVGNFFNHKEDMPAVERFFAKNNIKIK